MYSLVSASFKYYFTTNISAQHSLQYAHFNHTLIKDSFLLLLR